MDQDVAGSMALHHPRDRPDLRTSRAHRLHYLGVRDTGKQRGEVRPMSREYQPPDNKIEQPLPTDKGGLPKASCPTCGYAEMDSASCVTGEKVEPRPGDFSLCLNCARG